MRAACLWAILLLPAPQDSALRFLDDRFQLPAGFRIYRYASREVAPGGYSIAFDGQGRVYVGGEGTIVRLVDRDGDGMAEASEPIAAGLGNRCPQGLLIVGERIYATGDQSLLILGDPDASGRPRSRKKVGGTLRGGGDHGTHALVRGLDGHLYFAAGNGSGQKGRSHITAETSPCAKAEGATIFRIDPEGREWEAWSTGGRNFYGFAMNEMGEAFLVDSDGEGHYGLPTYGTVRFWHAPPGGDRGWRDHAGEGSWPGYWPDVVPAIAELGRGSPSASVFYEHAHFPEAYRGAFLSGDYLWKRVDNGNHAYVTSGRLFAFLIRPRGAGWESERRETFAEPRAAAEGAPGFAVLDLAVAPDGSLLVTGHGEGVYRIIYDPEKKGPGPLVPKWPEPAKDEAGILRELLALPQPEEEWSRAREEALRALLPERGEKALLKKAFDTAASIAERLRAIRLLAPSFATLYRSDLEVLSLDRDPRIRAQGIWLLGLRGGARPIDENLAHADPLVRRRSLEALQRLVWSPSGERLLPFLADASRPVRYAAIQAIARRDPDSWTAKALASPSPEVRLGALVALSVGGHRFPQPAVTGALRRLADEGAASRDAAFILDVLRATQLHLEAAPDLRERLLRWLNDLLESEDYRLVREASRLSGRLRGNAAGMLKALERAPDVIQQFHLVQMLAPIEDGWTPEMEDRMVRWLDRSDAGEISEPRGKGFLWMGFWREIVRTFVRKHPEAVRRGLEGYSLAGAFGGAALDLAAERDGLPAEKLAALRKRREEATRPRPGVQETLAGRVRTNEDLKKYLLSPAAGGGDAKKGAEVFVRAGCAACHTPGGGGRVLAPDLAPSLKGKSLAEVVESVVEPGAKIEEKYRSHIVVTKDDQMLQGFLSEQSADEVVLLDGARLLRIARKSIDRMKASDLSAMPEGLANRLSDAELRDLLAFLLGN